MKIQQKIKLAIEKQINKWKTKLPRKHAWYFNIIFVRETSLSFFVWHFFFYPTSLDLTLFVFFIISVFMCVYNFYKFFFYSFLYFFSTKKMEEKKSWIILLNYNIFFKWLLNSNIRFLFLSLFFIFFFFLDGISI